MSNKLPGSILSKPKT